MRHLIQFIVYLAVLPFILLYLFLFKPRFVVVAIINAFKKQVRFREHFEKAPLSSQPYTLTIQNTTSEIKKAALFGYNKYIVDHNFGSQEGLIITPPFTNVSYLEVISQAKHKPFTLGLIWQAPYYGAFESPSKENVPNLNATICLYNERGEWSKEPIKIYSSIEACPMDQNGDKSAVYQYPIDGNNYIELDVPPNSAFNLYFFRVHPAIDNRVKLVDQYPAFINWVRTLFRPRKITEV